MSGISEVDLKDFEQVEIRVLEIEEEKDGSALAQIK